MAFMSLLCSKILLGAVTSTAVMISQESAAKVAALLRTLSAALNAGGIVMPPAVTVQLYSRDLIISPATVMASGGCMVHWPACRRRMDVGCGRDERVDTLQLQAWRVLSGTMKPRIDMFHNTCRLRQAARVASLFVVD